MVRLKVEILEYNDDTYSRFQFLMVRLKASAGDMSGGGISRFQFLMVRLKELHHRHCFRRRIISIPYGAIKSLAESL